MIKPIATPATSEMTSGQPLLTKVIPRTAADRPLTEPTDRSISPSSRTRTMPMAMTPTEVVCSVRLTRLRLDRNELLAIWKTAHRTQVAGAQPGHEGGDGAADPAAGDQSLVLQVRREGGLVLHDHLSR
jgi:hypothetical protein